MNLDYQEVLTLGMPRYTVRLHRFTALGSKGSPVRIRRGPATVKATKAADSHCPGVQKDGKARRVELSLSQETLPECCKPASPEKRERCRFFPRHLEAMVVSYEIGLILFCIRNASCACVGLSGFLSRTETAQSHSCDHFTGRGRIDYSIDGSAI